MWKKPTSAMLSRISTGMLVRLITCPRDASFLATSSNMPIPEESMKVRPERLTSTVPATSVSICSRKSSRLLKSSSPETRRIVLPPSWSL